MANPRLVSSEAAGIPRCSRPGRRKTPLRAIPRCWAAGPAPKRFRAAAPRHDSRCEVPQPPSAPGSPHGCRGSAAPTPAWGWQRPRGGRGRWCGAMASCGAPARPCGLTLPRLPPFREPGGRRGQRRNPSARLRGRGRSRRCGLKAAGRVLLCRALPEPGLRWRDACGAEIRGFSGKQGGLSRPRLAQCLSRCCRTQLDRGCLHCWASSKSPSLHKPAWIALTCCHGKVAHLIAEVTAPTGSTRLPLADRQKGHAQIRNTWRESL